MKPSCAERTVATGVVERSSAQRKEEHKAITWCSKLKGREGVTVVVEGRRGMGNAASTDGGGEGAMLKGFNF